MPLYYRRMDNEKCQGEDLVIHRRRLFVLKGRGSKSEHGVSFCGRRVVGSTSWDVRAVIMSLF